MSIQQREIKTNCVNCFGYTSKREKLKFVSNQAVIIAGKNGKTEEKQQSKRTLVARKSKQLAGKKCATWSKETPVLRFITCGGCDRVWAAQKWRY